MEGVNAGRGHRKGVYCLVHRLKLQEGVCHARVLQHEPLVVPFSAGVPPLPAAGILVQAEGDRANITAELGYKYS